MKKFWITFISLTLCFVLFAACGKADSSSVSVPAQPVGAGAGGGTPPGSNQADITSIPSGAGQSAPVTPGNPDMSAETKTITGTVSDAAMGQLYVEVDGSGQTLAFPFGDADVTADTRPGNRVVITYTGVINGNDTSGITVISIAPEN